MGGHDSDAAHPHATATFTTAPASKKTTTVRTRRLTLGLYSTAAVARQLEPLVSRHAVGARGEWLAGRAKWLEQQHADAEQPRRE